MLKNVLQNSWNFFTNNYNDIAAIILPFVIPVELISGIYKYYFVTVEFDLYEQIFPVSLHFLALPVYSVAVIFYMASKSSGEITDIKSLWVKGLSNWGRYIILYALILISVMLGIIIFIIPGIILGVRLAFADFCLLYNNTNPLVSIKNSWNATKDYKWIIFKGYALIALITFLPYYLLTGLYNESYIPSIVFNSVLNIIYSVVNMVYTIFAYNVYKLQKIGITGN